MPDLITQTTATDLYRRQIGCRIVDAKKVISGLKTVQIGARAMVLTKDVHNAAASYRASLESKIKVTISEKHRGMRV